MSITGPEPPFSIQSIGACPRCRRSGNWTRVDTRAVVRCMSCGFEVARVVVVRAAEILEHNARPLEERHGGGDGEPTP